MCDQHSELKDYQHHCLPPLVPLGHRVLFTGHQIPHITTCRLILCGFEHSESHIIILCLVSLADHCVCNVHIFSFLLP